MVAETLATLAAAAGTAAAQAFGTEAWTTMRARVAEVFGRSDRDRTAAALRRLDESALALSDDGQSVDANQVSVLLAASLRAQFEVLLDSLGEEEQRVVVGLLHALLGQQETDHEATAGTAAITVWRNIKIHTEGESTAVVHNEGGIHIERPTRPGAEHIEN
ncbi:hypothetical protein [Streptomyces sp. NPDC058644]|uniref:hypothetical protein n=1 Tax=unclassified Streptomyces TaxID=2593676 RepID=UPI0036592188